MKTSASKLLFTVIFLCTIFMLFWYFPTNNGDFIKFKRLKFFSPFYACVENEAIRYDNNNTAFMAAFKQCITEYIPVRLSQLENFTNKQEQKYFLPMAADFDEGECNWLTIGIGGDTKAEKDFHERHPKCKVWGADPTPNNIANFDDYGKAIAVGIGLKDANISLMVRTEKGYRTTMAQVLKLTNYLDQYPKTRLIHYLTIDIEGFEYRIIENLVHHGVFAEDEVEFCQIDAELHNPKSNNSKYPVVDEALNLHVPNFILRFIKPPSPYLPIFNGYRFKHLMHQQVTFVNILNPICERAFKFSKYLI